MNGNVEELVNEFKNHGKNTPCLSVQLDNAVARLVDVYDGDTITVVLKVFGGYYKFPVRLFGIDTCEIKSKSPWNHEMAIKARDTLVKLATNDSDLEKNVVLVRLTTTGTDKYGRLLCKVTNLDGTCDFSQKLLDLRLAYNYTGNKKLDDLQQRQLLEKN
ncbi:hypothetical protein EBZ38_10120 [bacterium]|nr:hypothetical protein [bacterium]NDD84609.1 hypothetical protein [bacterium]